jgi:hypothetical protein
VLDFASTVYRAGVFETSNIGIFGSNVENTCIAASPDLYIPLQLAASGFTGSGNVWLGLAKGII